MLEQDGRALLLLPASNYVGGSLEPVRKMMEHENALISLGDGGAHYGMICDSSYTSFLLSYWVRDRTRGPRLPMAKNGITTYSNGVHTGALPGRLLRSSAMTMWTCTGFAPVT